MEQKLVLRESFNKNKSYERGNHYLCASMWYFEWHTKYRYNAFRKWKNKKLMEACIRGIASKHEVKFMELSVEPEYMHGTAMLSMTLSPATAK